MPVRSYRPPLRKNIPLAYHAGATARDFTDRAGRRVVNQATNASVDKLAQVINLGVDAFLQLLIVLTGGGLFSAILIFALLGGMKESGNSAFKFVLQILGLPTSVFGGVLGALPGGASASDMSDLGAKVEKGQVFNRFDGGTVAVNSGWGPRNTGIPGASTYHRGIDLPLEEGYPAFTWTETEVVCTKSKGYGNLGTLKLANGQVYEAGHLHSCNSGNYQAGQIFGRIGSTGVSSGNHLHWNQKNSLGQLVHPQTNPLQAVITGKWPGATGSAGGIGGIDVDFIKNLEGFHPTAYVDGTEGGRTRWSWGYGTKAPGPGQTVSQEQAHQDMVAYLSQHCLPIIPESLTANQKTAAASLCYNAGPGVKSWALWKQIEAGGDVNFTSYTRNTAGANLLPRRQKEQDMWDGK
jgi:GH24 family phage-related lysozyme (muramidase)/murein DD-endopeptidase MepM/ murein hydrolase activator NlpD